MPAGNSCACLTLGLETLLSQRATEQILVQQVENRKAVIRIEHETIVDNERILIEAHLSHVPTNLVDGHGCEMATAIDLSKTPPHTGISARHLR
jgi:hypothetical protein